MLEKTTKKYWLGRDGEKHAKLCLDVSQSSYDLVLFSVDMYLPGESYIHVFMALMGVIFLTS